MAEQTELELQFDVIDHGLDMAPLETRRIRVQSRFLSSKQRAYYQAQLMLVFKGKGGTTFEDAVAGILKQAFPGFIDPDAYGNKGDLGCDGILDGGKIVFACYGADQIRCEPKHLRGKVKSDLDKAIKNFKRLERWVFITNAKITSDFMRDMWYPLVAEHGPGSEVSITMELWDFDKMNDMLLDLPLRQLNHIFPGEPNSIDFVLSEFVKIIQALPRDQRPQSDDGRAIPEVSPHKMDYNALGPITRAELGEGIKVSGIIDEYFERNAPSKRDEYAQRMRRVYEAIIEYEDDNDAIVASLYENIGGEGYRTSGPKLSMATYATVAYFFQSCDIFENAPEDWRKEEAS